MLQLSSIVHCNITNKLNSQNSTIETTHLKQPLLTPSPSPLFYLVNSPLHLTPSILAHTNLFSISPLLIMNLYPRMALTFHTHRDHILPHNLKKPIILPFPR